MGAVAGGAVGLEGDEHAGHVARELGQAEDEFARAAAFEIGSAAGAVGAFAPDLIVVALWCFGEADDAEDGEGEVGGDVDGAACAIAAEGEFDGSAGELGAEVVGFLADIEVGDDGGGEADGEDEDGGSGCECDEAPGGERCPGAQGDGRGGLDA